MQADEQHPIIFPEDLLRSIPMMDIIIHHSNALQPPDFQSMCCCYCHIVEDAEAHAFVTFCMVPWRPVSARHIKQLEQDKLYKLKVMCLCSGT